jgi:hypothetical protein
MITFNTTPAAYFAPHWPLLNRPMTFRSQCRLWRCNKNLASNVLSLVKQRDEPYRPPKLATLYSMPLFNVPFVENSKNGYANS